MTPTATSTTTIDATPYWLPSSSTTSATTTTEDEEGKVKNPVDCICLGTGRFLRSVLVPALVQAGYHPALIQTRGRSFLEYMHNCQKDKKNSYPVDTVLASGEVQTDEIPCYGAFSMAAAGNCKQAVYDTLLPLIQENGLFCIGIGVTEAGLASPQSQSMLDLYELLCKLQQQQQQQHDFKFITPNQKLCVINTDNVPNNGSVIQQHILTLAKEKNDETMISFLHNKVVFFNSMVDRITSQREGSNGMVPRAEPMPLKALVLLDEHEDLPPSLGASSTGGVVVRKTHNQLQADIALKLRVANGTHTAAAHVMALLKLTMTDALSKNDNLSKLLLDHYLDTLVEHQIMASGIAELSVPPHSPECIEAWKDWRTRLTHPHFGLSTFFITQNGAAKGGIRLGPTVLDLMKQQSSKDDTEKGTSPTATTTSTNVSVLMAFAFAVLLRWLTPSAKSQATETGIFTGWFPGASRYFCTNKSSKEESADTVEYADQLRYNLNEGWYEFRCALNLKDNDTYKPLSEVLGELTLIPKQPDAYVNAIRSYLTAPEGGNLGNAPTHLLDIFSKAIATLYGRMVAGDSPQLILNEMKECQGIYNEKGMKTDCSALLGTEINLKGVEDGESS